ncbi:MAG: response regulator [Verrucomicrobiota bacterium]
MKKTILVVEDEPDLLEIMQDFLAMAGLSVLVAKSGPSAMEIWKKKSAEIDLVLTDVTLPDGTTGVALGEKLCAANPALKIIYTSGHSAEMVARLYTLPEGARFLQKPFPPSVLVDTVQTCLNA